MDYAQELKKLLRPLGLYELDEGIGAAELDSIGRELDGVWEALEKAERESLPLSAEGLGLESWEAILPYVPAWQTADDRREAIRALLLIGDGNATVRGLNTTLAGCGIAAAVEESETHQSVLVRFPGVRGVPDSFEALCRRIEQILPCHLGVEYLMVYLTWQELEALFATWEAVEAAGDWEHLEKGG